MTDLMKQLTARKVERRRQLAALPVGEKLRMLEEMVAAAKKISHPAAQASQSGASEKISSRKRGRRRDAVIFQGVPLNRPLEWTTTVCGEARSLWRSDVQTLLEGAV
jgi:hypothetical protein